MKEIKNINSNNRYSRAFIFSFVLILAGAFCDYFSNSSGTLIPPAPYNIYILLSLVTFIVFLHLFYGNTRLIHWLSSVPVAISSIAAILLLVILMGFIPQSESSNTIINRLSLNDLKNSNILAINAFFILISLGLVTIKRLTPFSFKNIGFFMNHFGVWLVIAAAIFGSTDIVKLRLTAYEEGNPEWRAQNNIHIFELPIAIKLNDFGIEEYAPKLAFIDVHKGEIIEEYRSSIAPADSGSVHNISGWNITIEQMMQQSVRFSDKYVPFFSKGACASAYAKCISETDTVEGWISAGSYLHGSEYLQLDHCNALVLLKPEPARYYSEVKLFAQDGTTENRLIEVNKPVKFKGWNIYQLSYDETKGRWSDYSVFELVKDPWLPVVYIGLFMVLAGAVYLFSFANRKRL